MKTILKSLLFLALFQLFHHNNANAQTFYCILDIDDSSSLCNTMWTVKFYQNPTTILGSYTTTAVGPGRFQPGCLPLSGGTTLDYITIEDANGNCTPITFGSSGSFPYTATTPSCGFPPCSSSIDCSGGTPSFCGATDWYIIIRIRP